MEQFVQVALKNRRSGEYKGSYSYIADVPVQVGDIVMAPTKYGDAEAKIIKTDVPISEIQCRVGQLLHITSSASPSNLFDEFLK